MSLEERHPATYHLPSPLRVIQSPAAVAGGHAGTEVLCQTPLVLYQVLRQRLKGHIITTGVVHGQRKKHPADGRNVMEEVVVHSLTTN